MNGSSSAIVQQLGQVRLRLADVDVGVAIVAEDTEAAIEVEVDRRRLEVLGSYGSMPIVPASIAARMSRSERTLIERILGARNTVLGTPLGVQGVHLALEVLEVLEALVHAGEPNVGDLVECRAGCAMASCADPR